MADIGTAYVQIVPKAEGISGQISGLLGGESQKAGAAAGGMFSKVFSSKVVKGAAIAGGAMLAGVGVASAALKKGIKETAAYGDNVDKMSQKLGLSSDAYQKWDYVLNLAGTDMQSMTTGLKTLTNQFQSAKDGNQSSIESFEKLGISMEEAANMSREDLFGAAIKGLQGMSDTTERAALANKLFGKSGQNLTPLFNQSAKATEDLMKQAEKYGMVMPEAAVKASAAFQDSVTTMQMTMTGLKNRMMAEFLPAATQITDGLAKMFTGDMSGLDDVIAGIEGIASKCAEMAPKLLEVGGKMIAELGKGLLSKAGSIGNSAGTIIGKLVTKLIASVPKLLTAGVKLIAGLVKGLIKALPEIISAIKTIVSKMVDKFKATDWKAVGSRILEHVVKGIRSVLSGLWSLIKSIVRGVLDYFGFTGLVAKVRETFESVKGAIQEKIEAAKEKVRSVIETIKGFFPFSVGQIFTGWFKKISLWFNKSDDGGSTSSSTTTEYFAKAMSQPYTFKKPTNFMAGEAGDETLFGRAALLHDMRKAVEGAKSSPAQITNYFTINNADDPEAVADAITRRLSLQMRSA